MTRKETQRLKRERIIEENGIIFLDNVSKSYSSGSPALNGVSLSIGRGEFVFIVGDSGSGKSTLIKLLLRELTATSGSVYVMGNDLAKLKHRQIPRFRRNLGVVFQDFRLLKDRNVYENVAFAQRVIEADHKRMRSRVMEVLSQVGLEKKADTRPIYAMAAPDLLEKEQVGTMKELDLEAVAALEPDLVVMPKKLMDYAAPLEELGIPVLVVNPESHEALTGMLELLGQACGVEDRAQALTDYYEEQLARVAQLVDGLERPTVYMGGNSSYLTAAPGDMYQSSLIETAGGVNAAADLTGGYWTEVSYESILAMAPQVILIPAGADYTAQDILGDPQLAAVPAVQYGAVYEMPSGIEEWDSPIPSGILGTMWLTSVLHPDVYPFETFTADVQDFYKTFYGFEIDPALITK